MIEVWPGLYVGDEDDEEGLRGVPGWFYVHAAKEPYHRAAIGYRGRGLSPDHPEYLMAEREGCLILNLVDVDNVSWIRAEIIDAAVQAVADNLGRGNVLVHCNRGRSRSPSIAFLFLLKHTPAFDDCSGIDEALTAFRTRYPYYAPARGMSDYVRLNWVRYVGSAA